VRGVALNHNTECDYGIGASVDRILSAKRKLKCSGHTPDLILAVSGGLKCSFGTGQKAIRDFGVPAGYDNRNLKTARIDF
jgi:hypothetical protein